MSGWFSVSWMFQVFSLENKAQLTCHCLIASSKGFNNPSQQIACVTQLLFEGPHFGLLPAELVVDPSKALVNLGCGHQVDFKARPRCISRGGDTQGVAEIASLGTLKHVLVDIPALRNGTFESLKEAHPRPSRKSSSTRWLGTNGVPVAWTWA